MTEHTVVPLGLDTADRLARGELRTVVFNHAYSYRLAKREWPIFEAAKATGYLVMPRSDAAYRRLEHIWERWCEPRGWPVVLLKPRVRYAAIDADTIAINAPQPSPAQLAPIERLFEEHAHGWQWHVNPTYLCVSRVPIQVAPLIAGRIVAVLWRALGLPAPQIEVS